MYTLDKKAAINADQIGKFLSETGKYIGTIVGAEDGKASTGTRHVVLTLRADDGRETRQFINTVKTDGTKLSGYDLLMAIMTCVKVRDIKPTAGQVRRWDADAKAEYTEPGTIFPELINKRLGFLLQKTEEASRKNPGETAWSARLYAVFEANTELMANEILTGKTAPETLAAKVATLADRPMKTRPAPARTGSDHTPDYGSDGGFGGGMSDDIPFSPAYARAAWSVV